MTTIKRNTKMPALEDWVASDGDLMKSLLKEALQEVLEGEMTEFLGAAPSERTEARQDYPWRPLSCRVTSSRRSVSIFDEQ